VSAVLQTVAVIEKGGADALVEEQFDRAQASGRSEEEDPAGAASTDRR